MVEALWPIGVPAAPLVAPHEVVSLPQTESRGFFETVTHPVIGPLRLPAFPARLSSRTLPYHRRHAPLLGQDNQALLGGWLGLGDAELAALERRWRDRHSTAVREPVPTEPPKEKMT